jgi:hypothetical protein
VDDGIDRHEHSEPDRGHFEYGEIEHIYPLFLYQPPKAFRIYAKDFKRVHLKGVYARQRRRNSAKKRYNFDVAVQHVFPSA